MKINIKQTISNTLSEARELISSKTSEVFVLYADEGKQFKDKRTGSLIGSFVVIGSGDSKDNYEEVEM